MPTPRAHRWDIFCTVVDNYGDIGVCWRLARQLVAEHGLAVRLWLDDLDALQRLWPAAQPEQDEQWLAGVEVRRWPVPFPAVALADVVIEAFACELPAAYRAAMAAAPAPIRWINLEYLSAEPWVAGCHRLPSPQPGGLTKHFFFPGFGPDTGGLLRERDLITRRRAFQADPAAREVFLAGLGIEVPAGARLLSLFAYENAGLGGLLDALAGAAQPTLCLVPEGRLLSSVGAWLGGPIPAVGTRHQRGALTLAVLPFLEQDDYDRLLWSCDFNGVRGEDSFVRALWAGRPLLWHIYPQQDEAHWAKLDAFLALYAEGLPAPAAAALRALWQGWNAGAGMAAAWRQFEPLLPLFDAHARQFADGLSAPDDLATSLVQFCANQV